MTDRFDTDLRDRFQALRREERAAVPSREYAGARRVYGGRTLVPRLALATVAVAVAVLALSWGMRCGRPASPSGGDLFWPGAWESPTAFLLSTPGEDLLSTVPRLGRLPDSYGIPAPEDLRSSDPDREGGNG